MTNRDAVLETITGLVRAMVADWDLADEVTESTQLFGNMNWRSVDFIVLANDVQDHYGRRFPFVELLAEFETGGRSDLTVGELAGFVRRHLQHDATVA